MTGTVAYSVSAFFNPSPPRGINRSMTPSSVATSRSSSPPLPPTTATASAGTPMLTIALRASSLSVARGRVEPCKRARGLLGGRADLRDGLRLDRHIRRVPRACGGPEALVEHEVVAMHGLVGGTRQQLAHLDRLQADHPTQLGGR